MSDTPRTDAECAKRYEQGYQLPDLRELCAQIERELAEAREEVARLSDYSSLTHQGFMVIKKQRDQLAEALDTLTLVVGLTPIAGNKDALQEAMDHARATLAAVKPKPQPTHTFNGHPVTLVSNNGPLIGMVEIQRADGSTEYVYRSELILL
jgi:sugar-specific transcriptional regulator TrmB